MDNGCNMACSGNSTEQCGGGNHLTVFYSGGGNLQVNPGPPGWNSLGCYTDSTGSRTLTTGMGVAGGASAMTVALCTSACKQNGFSLAGVEYANECYCGNSFSNGGGPAPDGPTGCNMVCAGNKTEFCGGPNRLNVYTTGSGTNPGSTASAGSGGGGGGGTLTVTTIGANANPTKVSDGPGPLTTSTTAGLTAVDGPQATGLANGWSYKGCYIDTVNARILPTAVPSTDQMTQESCVASCAANGFSVAGAEYGTQCYCGNTIIQGGKQDTANPNGCNMACGGNANEKCGGPNRMSIFSNITGTVPVIAPPISQNTSLPGKWQYAGCLM